jgi:hypothetical protein
MKCYILAEEPILFVLCCSTETSNGVRKFAICTPLLIQHKTTDNGVIMKCHSVCSFGRKLMFIHGM